MTPIDIQTLINTSMIANRNSRYGFSLQGDIINLFLDLDLQIKPDGKPVYIPIPEAIQLDGIHYGIASVKDGAIEKAYAITALPKYVLAGTTFQQDYIRVADYSNGGTGIKEDDVVYENMNLTTLGTIVTTTEVIDPADYTTNITVRGSISLRVK